MRNGFTGEPRVSTRLALVSYVAFFILTIITFLVVVPWLGRRAAEVCVRVSPCLYGLFLLPWIVTTENEAGGQLGCSILNKALFCIFSCIFFPNFSFLQRDYWLLERRMYGFTWLFCGGWVDGFHLYSFFGTCFLRSSSSTFHSVILILGFCFVFWSWSFTSISLTVYPGGLAEGFLPTQYEIISASNQSFSLLTSPPLSFLGMNWSDVIWETRYCGVFLFSVFL